MSKIRGQVGMSAGVGHNQDKLRIVLLPYQEPIAFDMAFPKSFIASAKFMRAVAFGKGSGCLQ